MRSAFLYLSDYMNLDGERVWSVATDDYFSQISEERAFAKSSGELDRNEIAELIVKITNPKATRYSENSLCWKDVKMSKNILSFDFFDRVEKMVPFHVLTSIETHLTVELEKMVVGNILGIKRCKLAPNEQ
uniref:Uncharacterized protein n=2 Tax=Caenorhabditis japonica TaxID=281687 RepID=A0A8R1ENV1_CAEJA